MTFEFDIEGGNFSRAGTASSDLKKILNQLSIEPAVTKRIVVATYEAEVNVVAHAWSGKIMADIDPEKVMISVLDEGPGIENIELAMQKGYSTASPKVREMGFGAGMGLPNIKNNCDQLEISSVPGNGTQLYMTFKIS